ncbi:YhbY family RNA-binding protein [Bifidobacterium aquikefiri]|uniref:YhbY family RNA-binding protein n=1 Tax=Bifidobacterium aquikefiri TaxID=1653207 RepID=UPI0039EC3D0F
MEEQDVRSAKELNKHQVKQLRALGNHLNPLIIIGKSNLTEASIKQANETLENRELIKCSVLNGSDLTARDAASQLAEKLRASVVQVIGNRFVIYRETHRDDVEKIKLVR